MRKTINDLLGSKVDLDLFEVRRSMGLDKQGFPIYSIGGSDQPQGYNTEGDVVTVTADGRDLNAMWAEFQLTLQIFNERRQQLINLLTFPVTTLIEDVPQVGDAEFEMATEFGEPVGIRTALTYFSLGYDFHDYDMAVRYTWKFLRDADARHVEAIHQQALNADNRLVFRKVMEAIFDSANRATNIRQQNIPVYPLYNADGTVPPTYKNNVFSGTHSHYMVSNAATLDSGDFEALYENIAEHGFGQENGSVFVCMAPRALVKEMRKWKAGEVNQNTVEANYDFIPSPSQPALIVPNEEGLIGSRPPAVWNGLPVVGSYMNVLIIEEDYIPSGYMFMFATGGAGNLQNIVGLREHANPAHRGLRLLPGNNQRYPLVDSYYSRGFGTGIRQRGGAAVMQIKASGSYDIPTQYKRGGGLG